jgi:hypothetical protein
MKLEADTKPVGVSVIISEPEIEGLPHMQCTELRPSEDGSAWTTQRTLTTPIGSKSRHYTWLLLKQAALRDWGVLIPDSSDPQPQVWS